MTKARSYLFLAAKLCVAGLAFGFILSRQSWADLRAAVLQISPWSLVLAITFQATGLVVGTVRWRALIRAYGGDPEASFGAMLRSYWIGDFYNVYVPGAVGGDILRGVVTRRAFAQRRGPAGAFAVVLIERCLGLGAVLTLTAFAAAFQHETKLGSALLPYSLVGLAAVCFAVLAITHSRLFVALAPEALKPLLQSLPRLELLRPFLLGCLLSLATQSIAVVCGHLLVSSISTEVTLADSFLALPMATAAGFFPLSVAGIGPRDVAVVALYEVVGVARAHGTATAIGYSFVTLFVAGFGGIIQLFAPLARERVADADARS